MYYIDLAAVFTSSAVLIFLNHYSENENPRWLSTATELELGAASARRLLTSALSHLSKILLGTV